MCFFNNEGPIKEDLHYNLPPLQCWDLAEILTFIDH